MPRCILYRIGSKTSRHLFGVNSDIHPHSSSMASQSASAPSHSTRCAFQPIEYLSLSQIVHAIHYRLVVIVPPTVILGLICLFFFTLLWCTRRRRRRAMEHDLDVVPRPFTLKRPGRSSCNSDWNSSRGPRTDTSHNLSVIIIQRQPQSSIMSAAISGTSQKELDATPSMSSMHEHDAYRPSENSSVEGGSVQSEQFSTTPSAS